SKFNGAQSANSGRLLFRSVHEEDLFAAQRQCQPLLIFVDTLPPYGFTLPIPAFKTETCHRDLESRCKTRTLQCEEKSVGGRTFGCHTIVEPMKVSPRIVKFCIAGALLFILVCLVVIQQAFNLNPFFRPTDPPDIVVSSALSALVFLVLLVFVFVLSRTVFKVWMV